MTGLSISAAMDGVNSILKFISYTTAEQKKAAKAEMLNVSSTRVLFEGGEETWIQSLTTLCAC